MVSSTLAAAGLEILKAHAASSGYCCDAFCGPASKRDQLNGRERTIEEWRTGRSEADRLGMTGVLGIIFDGFRRGAQKPDEQNGQEVLVERDECCLCKKPVE